MIDRHVHLVAEHLDTRTEDLWQVSLRRGDVSWEDFLKAAPLHGSFQAHVADASDVTNILFSSGTTGAAPMATCGCLCSAEPTHHCHGHCRVITLPRSMQTRGLGLAGEPKAIPWTHVTPIRCGVDGWAQQDVRRGNVVAWPTNLGWMMGPWLLYAALLNGAAVALFQASSVICPPTGIDHLPLQCAPFVGFIEH